MRCRSLTTDAKECRSPQWKVTVGGGALLLVSSVPGRFGSISISLRILPVCWVTALPVSVVSKVRSSFIQPPAAPAYCSVGTPLPGIGFDTQLLRRPTLSVSGLYRQGTCSPPSISR